MGPNCAKHRWLAPRRGCDPDVSAVGAFRSGNEPCEYGVARGDAPASPQFRPATERLDVQFVACVWALFPGPEVEPVHGLCRLYRLDNRRATLGPWNRS